MSSSNLNNIRLGKNLLLAASFGTAIVSPAFFELENQIVPQTSAEYSSTLQEKPWDLNIFYKQPIPALSSSSEYKCLSSFIETISRNSKNLDEDLQEIVNDRFWDLL